MIAHTCSPLFAFKTPRISKFSWSWVKESLTLPNLLHRGLTYVKDLRIHARIAHVIVSSRTDAHFSPVEYSVRNFLSILGSTKVGFDQVWDQTSITLQRDRTPFWNSVQVVGHILAFVPPPNTYTETMAWLWTMRQTCWGGEIWDNVFNPGLMHKLIV